MFNLKIAAFAGAALFAFAIGAPAAEAATIKKRAGVTYSCTVQKHYEKCVRVKKKIRKKHVIQQAEWPITYQTSSSNIHEVASKFLGLHERIHAHILKPFMNVNPIQTPWCAAFVNAVLNETGLRGTGSNHAMSFANYGVKTNDPQKGDIVVMTTHVGFFDGYTYRNGKKYVVVLGGNQANKVQISQYPASKVVSYRRAT